MIVLDTNVISEVMRPEPASVVLRWLSKQPVRQLFTTTITEAEILYGLELMSKGKRRAALQSLAEAMFEKDLGGRILSFDRGAAQVFAQIAASRRAAGRPITDFDAQIAAIARHHRAAIATRNHGHFDDCGVAVVNPWTSNE